MSNFSKYFEMARFGSYRTYRGGYKKKYRISPEPQRPLTPEEETERKKREEEQLAKKAEFAKEKKVFDANEAKWNEYQDLGWANSWKETPEIVRNCARQGHEYPDKGTIHDPSSRGIENRVFCSICGYRYRYDSSD